MYSSRMPLTIAKSLYNLKIISFEDPFTFRLKNKKILSRTNLTICFEELACPILLVFGYSKLGRG